jgi:O-antigen/teichoic acid export membrane protein
LFIARVSVVAVNFLLIPLYLKYLGSSVVGFMALVASLINLCMVFDIGISTQATVYAAKFRQGEDRERHQAYLLAGEAAYWLMGLVIALCLCLIIRYWPENWIKGVLTSESQFVAVEFPILVMAMYVVLSWVQVFYNAALNGLGQQRSLCAATAFTAAARLLAIAGSLYSGFSLLTVLMLHTVLTLCQIIWSRIIYLRVFRDSEVKASLIGLAQAVKSTVNLDLLIVGILAALFTQIDKPVLAYFLTPDQFAAYAVAAMLSTATYLLIGPLYTSLVPYFVSALNDQSLSKLRDQYFIATELLVFVAAPSTMILVFFSEAILQFWLGDAAIARSASDIVFWLSLGVLVNSLLYVPYALQIASQWTRLSRNIHIAMATIGFPVFTIGVYFMAEKGAAISMLILYSVMFFVWTWRAHIRLIPGYHRQWLVEKVLAPIAFTAIAAWLASIAFDAYESHTRLTVVIQLGVILLTLSLLLLFISKHLRIAIYQRLFFMRKNSESIP